MSIADGLRTEVYTLQRELLQDRTKVKALSEELENPDNTHRWRKVNMRFNDPAAAKRMEPLLTTSVRALCTQLEGSDPGTYEMVQKIQALQVCL